MLVQIFLQTRQRAVDHADEIIAARHRTSAAADHVALRKIIRHHQHLAVILKAVRRALDQIIRRLTAVGKQNLHCAAGIIFRLAAPRARAVKKIVIGVPVES